MARLGVKTLGVTRRRRRGASVPALGPVNTVAPLQSGANGFVGTTRTCSTGTWTGTGTITYAYQWLRAGVAISGATANTYTLAEADVFTLVACRVTATDDEGSTSAVSNVVAVTQQAPNLAASDGLVGRTLTITVTGNTGGAATPSLSVLTLDGSNVLGDATGTGPWTYVVPDGLASQTVAWQVSATNSGGTDTVSGSEVVEANLFVPTAAGAIADRSWPEDSAISTLNVAADFTGTAPITYALAPSSAALPAGLSLSSAGAITGTPTTEAAQVNIVVRGTNAYGTDDTAFGVTITAAGDVTAPAITGLTIDTETDPDDIGISFSVSEDCNIYGIYTVDSDQTGIEGADIIAGKLADGTTDAPLAFGPVAVTEPSEILGDDITSLGDGLVRLYIVGQDAASNIGDPVVASWTRDTTAPVLSGVSATPGDTEIDVDWETDTAEGTARIQAFLAGETVTVQADSGDITVTASGAQSTVTLTGLTNDIAYDIYIVHEDVLGNMDTDSVLDVTPVASVGGGSSPSFVNGVADQTASPRTSDDFSLPASLVEGNYLVMCLSSSNEGETFTATDWTQIATRSSTTNEVVILQREITAGLVGATTVAVTFSNSLNVGCVIIQVADTSGANTGNVSAGNGTGGTSHAGRSITTSENNALVIEATALRNDDNPTPSPGFGANPAVAALAVGYQVQATAGATTGIPFTTIDSETGYPQITIEMVA